MVGFAIRGTAVLIIWLVARWALRRASAESRCLAHALAVAALLLLPLLNPLLPAVSVPCLPPEVGERLVADRPLQPLPEASPPPFRAVRPLTASESPPHAPFPVSLAALFGLVYGLGAALALARFALGLLRLRALVRHSVRPSGSLREALGEAMHALPTHRPVRLQVASEAMPVASPMTAGLGRHLILLPRDAVSWPRERLDAVLRHELAHIYRGDWLLLLLTRAALALYWFHPLAYLLAQSLRSDMEVAADDRVVASGLRPSEYASHLVAVAAAMKLSYSSVRE